MSEDTPPRRSALMNRTTKVVLALVILSIAVILVVASYLIRSYLRAVVQQFGQQHLGQVSDAAAVVEDDISNIAEDLAAAGALYQRGTSERERRRDLATMVLVVEDYKIIEIFDASGARVLSAEDERQSVAESRDVFEKPVAEIAALALQREPGDIQATSPIMSRDGGAYRAFATAVAPLRPTGSRIVVTILLDIQPIFKKLKVLASDRGSQLLLLGPRGAPSPVSSPEISDMVLRIDRGDREIAGLVSLVHEMREGRTGMLVLSQQDAVGLGLDPAEAVAAYSVVRTHGGEHWSIGTVSSILPLKAQQKQLVQRVLLIVAIIVGLLVGFTVYFIFATRRAATMQERLLHIDRLAHLHEKTEKILENIPIGVLALAEDGRITAANRALREWSPAFALGLRLPEAMPLAPRALPQKLLALVDACLAAGTVCSVHGERLALFGEEGQYSIHAVPLDRGFSEACALIVIEDVSEVKALASQLVRAEKLSTVGVLGAGIAHEIGTPLGVIRGRAERVLNKLGEDHPQAAGVRVIVDQIDLVSRTIRQLLDFSRVKPALVQPIDVELAAFEVAEFLRFEAERRKIEVEIDVTDGLPPIGADADQLQQVLVNLMMNSFDACSPRGHVKISARAERSEVISSWHGVRITVTDDGCGIPNKGQEQVFDPFFTTKKRGQGTGLGLTVVAHIVRNHGGQIELESRPGQGTTITLIWPVASLATEGRHAALA